MSVEWCYIQTLLENDSQPGDLMIKLDLPVMTSPLRVWPIDQQHHHHHLGAYALMCGIFMCVYYMSDSFS